MAMYETTGAVVVFIRPQIAYCFVQATDEDNHMVV